MRKNQIILIVVVLFLISFFSIFSYLLGQKSVRPKNVTIIPNILESKLIQSGAVTASGAVLEKTADVIILTANNENLTVSLNPETSVKRFLLQDGEKKVEEISFTDLEIGEVVNVEIAIDSTGKIWAKSISALPK